MTEHSVREDGVDGESPKDQADLVRLLDFLHRARGFDFTGYKRGSLNRRIRRRMQMVGIESFEEYLDHLEVHPDEFPQLFNLLLINVTGFFRDPAAWEALVERLPEIIHTEPGAPIRVWSAGCSSGEEPYTLAIMLAEAIGVAAFAQRVKIYATDVDEDALGHARAALYSQKSLESVPPALVEKYFTPNGSQFAFHKDLRRAVVFGRHDLVQDAPIPRVDILSCRNALMYFNAETQTRILERLRFALNPRGVLFLGKAEMLLTQSDLFTPLDLKQRLFLRSTKPGTAIRLRDKTPHEVIPSSRDAADEGRARLQIGAFDSSKTAQLIIDVRGDVAQMNTRAAQLFALSPSAIVGHPFHDLELSYRPVELRSCIEKVRVERRPMELKGIERISASGEKLSLDIDITGLYSPAGVYIGTLIGFSDATHMHQLQSDLRRSNNELEAAHQELQATSEELETTNEELQSTVEELETTNEELQSTNEELETMNEELQSTNEELQTINEELRQRGRDLNDLNAFHANVLATLRAGVAVLDQDLVVKTWNTTMGEMWGTRTDEVTGRRFLELDIGLPLERLRAPLRACLVSGEAAELVVESINRRGRSIECRVTLIALDRAQETRGVVVLVEEKKPS